jgi:hypothetical protein
LVILYRKHTSLGQGSAGCNIHIKGEFIRMQLKQVHMHSLFTISAL